MDLRKIGVVLMLCVLALSPNPDEQGSSSRKDGAQAGDAEKPRKRTGSRKVRRFPLDEIPGNTVYDFLCGRIEVNGHSALETVQQLQSNDRLAEAFQRLLMGPFELLAMFPSSQIFFRGVSAYQYKQICQSFEASSILFSAAKTVLELYGLTIVDPINGILEVVSKDHDSDEPKTESEHDLTQNSDGETPKTVESSSKTTSWGMTNVRYIQTHPKLLLGVLNCIRLCGFHKIARGVAELLLLEAHEFGVLKDLDGIIKKECVECVNADMTQPVASYINELQRIEEKKNEDKEEESSFGLLQRLGQLRSSLKRKKSSLLSLEKEIISDESSSGRTTPEKEKQDPKDSPFVRGSTIRVSAKTTGAGKDLNGKTKTGGEASESLQGSSLPRSTISRRKSFSLHKGEESSDKERSERKSAKILRSSSLRSQRINEQEKKGIEPGKSIADHVRQELGLKTPKATIVLPINKPFESEEPKIIYIREKSYKQQLVEIVSQIEDLKKSLTTGSEWDEPNENSGSEKAQKEVGAFSKNRINEFIIRKRKSTVENKQGKEDHTVTIVEGNPDVSSAESSNDDQSTSGKLDKSDRSISDSSKEEIYVPKEEEKEEIEEDIQSKRSQETSGSELEAKALQKEPEQKPITSLTSTLSSEKKFPDKGVEKVDKVKDKESPTSSFSRDNKFRESFGKGENYEKETKGAEAESKSWNPFSGRLFRRSFRQEQGKEEGKSKISSPWSEESSSRRGSLRRSRKFEQLFDESASEKDKIVKDSSPSKFSVTSKKTEAKSAMKGESSSSSAFVFTKNYETMSPFTRADSLKEKKKVKGIFAFSPGKSPEPQDQLQKDKDESSVDVVSMSSAKSLETEGWDQIRSISEYLESETRETSIIMDSDEEKEDS